MDIIFWFKDRRYDCPEEWFIRQRQARERLGATRVEAVEETIEQWVKISKGKVQNPDAKKGAKVAPF